ncbi:putative membrane protein (plasmid) [Ochrobactrum quorumnocens]|uniref:Putative membrane protein n=1 Tax=Ochrobactrum quorumnocens TaxID=271865 RepID=A0A248UNV0_9HYPH|nr:hypothetical protein [[Ochrobactrum] quorumnocens]ASV88306.1 putative membrane protein [[Ochrobactrum] quorumnocens]
MTEISPSGPMGALGRLHRWINGHKARRAAVVIGFFSVVWVLLFGGWIAIALLRGSTERNAGAVALLYVIMPFLSVVMLLLFHRMAYRRFWDDDRKRARNKSTKEWALETDSAPPAPAFDWPLTLQARHGIIYVLAITGLLFSFTPYQHQAAIVQFMVNISFGSATLRQLSGLLFGYLPLFFFAVCTMGITHRQQRRNDAGLLSNRERLLLRAEMNWLMSFGIALASVMLLNQTFGHMIISHL